MNLDERITLLREANPENIYVLDTVHRTIWMLVPKPVKPHPDETFYIMPATYTAICVYSESETEAY